VGIGILLGVMSVLQVVQEVILGSRLILGVRKYCAELVANSDEGTNMTSIAFQEREHTGTSGDV
jgi:hypothetical protein